MNIPHPLLRACDVVGGRAALASALGVTRQAIGAWAKDQVPADRCPTIERLTAGAVKCEELRPDVEWAALRRSNRIT